jgi:hypothetical protein
MKLESISKPLSTAPSTLDIDVASNIAPSIMKSVSSLDALVGLIPDNTEICNKIEELKSLLSSKLPQSTVIEDNRDQTETIIGYDANKTVSQQRAHIHGVGTTTLEFLPVKVVREAGFVEDVMKELDVLEKSNTHRDSILAKYKELAKWSEQMLRSALTLKNGVKELVVKKQLTGIFPKGTDIKEETVQELDSRISDLYIFEMYETMKVGLGEKAWVAISKRLKAEGHSPVLIEKLINRAIERTL